MTDAGEPDEEDPATDLPGVQPAPAPGVPVSPQTFDDIKRAAQTRRHNGIDSPGDDTENQQHDPQQHDPQQHDPEE